MYEENRTERSPNNFGFLRVALATLVVLSHSAELADGDRSREVLSNIFHSISFGELAVDGFFLISGYLITKSCLHSKTWLQYISKRVLRIYPGYIAAYIISIVIFGSIAGGNIASLVDLEQIKAECINMAKLGVPTLAEAFQGLHYPDLNASMRSIAYEFECYLLILSLGVFGVLHRPRLYLALTVLSILLMIGHTSEVNKYIFDDISIQNYKEFRLIPIFLCGGCFYILKKHITYTQRRLFIAAIGLIALLFIRNLAEPALTIFGGYILFWFALCYKSNTLSNIGSKFDLSYGIYLYAWPIQNLVIYFYRDISPSILFTISTITAAFFGYCSWIFVERPFLLLKKYTSQPQNDFAFINSSGMSPKTYDRKI